MHATRLLRGIKAVSFQMFRRSKTTCSLHPCHASKVGKLECVVLQVKGVLHQCASDDIAPLGGALAEYHFWKQRADNLQGLLVQVNSIGLELPISNKTLSFLASRSGLV